MAFDYYLNVYDHLVDNTKNYIVTALSQNDMKIYLRILILYNELDDRNLVEMLYDVLFFCCKKIITWIAEHKGTFWKFWQKRAPETIKEHEIKVCFKLYSTIMYIFSYLSELR